MRTLNPTLYEALERAFGVVHVGNQGCESVVTYERDTLYRKGRLRANSGGGEEYYVSCPFCSDTRYRLSINYRWGSRDPRTGDDFLWLCCCYNEECIKTREKQQELFRMVFPRGRYGRPIRLPTKPSPEPIEPAVIRLPESVPIEDLPITHPAWAYLSGRNFDREDLKGRGIRYCDSCTSSRPVLREERIVIPFYAPTALYIDSEVEGTPENDLFLAGWQARLIFNTDDKSNPKYLTAAGMHKSNYLYGLPLALKSTGPVVLVEGVADAWRVGPNGLAMLGKSLSQAQSDLMMRCFRGRSILVMLDDDAMDEAHETAHFLARRRRALDEEAVVGRAPVPCRCKDPAESTTSEIRAIVNRALRHLKAHDRM